MPLSQRQLDVQRQNTARVPADMGARLVPNRRIRRNAFFQAGPHVFGCVVHAFDLLKNCSVIGVPPQDLLEPFVIAIRNLPCTPPAR